MNPVVSSETTILETQDTHVHTFRSACGDLKCTPARILRRFERLGFDTVCLTDHKNLDTDSAIFEETRQEVFEIDTSLDVYVGCEAELVAPDIATLSESEADDYDIILMAATHYHVMDPDVSEWSSPRKLAEWILGLHRTVLSMPWVDILPHPFARTDDLAVWDEAAVLESIRDDELIEVVDMAADNGIAMEFRMGHAHTPGYRDFLERLTGFCVQRGTLFSSGSDAHSMPNVGRTLRFVGVMREMGLTNEHFLDVRNVARRTG